MIRFCAFVRNAYKIDSWFSSNLHEHLRRDQKKILIASISFNSNFFYAFI